MDYNTYRGPQTVGSNYSPYYQQAGTSVNPVLVQPIQPHPQQSNATGSLMTIFVNSEEEVNNYPVAAGLTVLLISFNQKKFWLKSTDTSGVPQTPRVFEFDEKTPLQNQNGSFVSRQEFSELNDKLDKLISELGGNK